MRKEIIDFLEDTKKTPKELPHIDYNRHLLAMLEIYRRIDIDRPNVLAQDCFMLLSTYRHYKISFESGTDFMRYGMSAIEMMVSLLISATDQYTQLPDSAINELGLYPFMDGTFGDYMRQHNRAKEIHEQEIAQAQNIVDSSAKGTGIGNNATANPETPPAAQKTPKTMEIYTPKPVGRPTGEFANTIADTYQNKADIIQEHTGNVLASMTDPKAVIALLVVYFRNGILKQCPTYWQTLRLLDIEAEEYKDKEKLCPFGKHQQYDKQRKIYFDENDSYLSLNDTDRKQDNEISSFIQDANKTYKTLLEKLNPKPQKKARKGA